MTQELFEILRPRINARVLEIIHSHLSDEQIALLLVKLINPYAVLSQQDEAKLRGVDRKTLRGMKARGEIPDAPSSEAVVNPASSPNLPSSGLNRPKTPRARKRSRKPV